MPLDPFFAERLRVHRRYLIDRALGDARARLRALWPFGAPATTSAAVPEPLTAPTAPAPVSPVAAPEATATGPAPDPARNSPRARHRRAALAWDRKELAEIGTPGPPLRTTEHTVPVAGYPDVRVRVYYPDAAGDESGAPAPACVAFFGGAFRIGGIDFPTTDAANRRRAQASGVAMVAVGYSLAPEHRYPTPVEQGYAALCWVSAHAAELGLDPERIGILGTSAGGCIAAAVTLANRDRAGLPLRVQILEVPVTDLTGAHVDLRVAWTLGIPAPLARAELRSVARTYIPDAVRAREPYASPLRAASHEGLPPAVILTAEYDPLRGDGEAYASALRRAGVEASAVRYLGVTHDIPMFTGVLDAARRWEADIVSALRRLHG